MKQKTITLAHAVIVPKDFTEFMKLSNVELRAVIYTMMITVNELEKASETQDMGIDPAISDTFAKVAKPHGVPSTEEENALANTPTVTAFKKGVNVTTDAGGDHKSSTLGKKIGKTSKYHFVNTQYRNDKFTTYRASTSINGKTISIGGSKDEVQCALMADSCLDGLGDEKRPRNRNDFPEVMEAYKAKRENNETI